MLPYCDSIFHIAYQKGMVFNRGCLLWPALLESYHPSYQVHQPSTSFLHPMSSAASTTTYFKVKFPQKPSVGKSTIKGKVYRVRVSVRSPASLSSCN